ncbi:MAG: adenylate/guanylate cyclase domain-containing protein [Bacteroidota bacterium]
MKKANFLKIVFLVSFWTLAVAFIVVFTDVVLTYDAPRYGSPPIAFDFGRVLVGGVLVCLIAGGAMASFEVLYFNRLLRKQPLGTTLLFKTAFYLANSFIFTSLTVLFLTSQRIDQPLFHETTISLFINYAFTPKALLNTIYLGIVVAHSLFILQVAEKFGQGVLMNFLVGKYHRPREEVRIFMFMDLKSSTAYAEKLGHTKYSRLIQDCFSDLTETVTRHNAQIYQYVGDEVVLTWDLAKGLDNNNCINAFFDYDKTLQQRGGYYRQHYGVIPEFKAGVNLGDVMVAEVGELKKEIAYHGDALNTAARIQEKCNEFAKRILISGKVRDALSGHPGQDFGEVGSIRLKGKEKPVNIYEPIAPAPQVHGQQSSTHNTC